VRDALHAEWTKLRTVTGTAWLLLGCVAATAALSALVAGASCTEGVCPADGAQLALSGVRLGQALVAVLAVVAVSNEYGTGMIRTTLAAIPRRYALLAAKSATVTAAVLVAAAVAVAGSLLFAWPLLGDIDPAPTLTGATVRAALGSVLYLALIGLLAIGVATAVRDSAASIGAVLGLLYLFPVLAQVVTDPDWQRHIQQIAPMNAGLAIQATTGLGDLPIGPWRGLGVLAAWSAAALLAGAALLRRRDA
jgi:ABC-2 type transport system permease protein